MESSAQPTSKPAWKPCAPPVAIVKQPASASATQRQEHNPCQLKRACCVLGVGRPGTHGVHDHKRLCLRPQPGKPTASQPVLHRDVKHSQSQNYAIGRSSYAPLSALSTIAVPKLARVTIIGLLKFPRKPWKIKQNTTHDALAAQTGGVDKGYMHM